jgi:hypothetical protein
MQPPRTLQLHPHGAGSSSLPLPVLAAFDPNTNRNWIASRIVKRLNLEYQQAGIHEDVPPYQRQNFQRTRIFVDLTCGKRKRNQQCQHRLYVVNKYIPDILLGSEFCSP